jgi:hypothetical protein
MPEKLSRAPLPPIAESSGSPVPIWEPQLYQQYHAARAELRMINQLPAGIQAPRKRLVCRVVTRFQGPTRDKMKCEQCGATEFVLLLHGEIFASSNP